MADRRKTGWTFWTTVVLPIVLVLYVASVGPACRIASRNRLIHPAVVAAYRPLGSIASACPGNSMVDVLYAWGALWEGSSRRPPFESAILPIILEFPIVIEGT